MRGVHSLSMVEKSGFAEAGFWISGNCVKISLDLLTRACFRSLLNSYQRRLMDEIIPLGSLGSVGVSHVKRLKTAFEDGVATC